MSLNMTGLRLDTVPKRSVFNRTSYVIVHLSQLAANQNHFNHQIIKQDSRL